MSFNNLNLEWIPYAISHYVMLFVNYAIKGHS